MVLSVSKIIIQIVDRIRNIEKRHPEFIIALGALAVGFIVSYLLLIRDSHSLVYYPDSVTHLVLSRRLFDLITPGIAQLGGVWLPITHLMLLPFVTNDFLFHTGLAGTIVSTSSMAVTAVVIFRIVKLQFGSARAGLLGSCLYLANPSVIYIGIIPMMEAPFMMFFVLFVYYVQKWHHIYTTGGNTWDQYRIILKCAVAVLLATLTRYEGWILPFSLIFILLIVLLITSREVWRRRIESLLVVAVPICFAGIILWILWNAVIFKDPLYFAIGPYSPHAQAASKPFTAYLQLHPINSLSILFDVAKAMYGIPTLILSLLGIASFVYMNRSTTLSFSLLMVLMLMLPMTSDFIAMVQGSGEIYPTTNPYPLYNARYLTFIAPLIAFGSISLIMFIVRARKKLLTICTLLILVASYSFTIVTQPLEVGKATAMSDSALLPFQETTQMTFEAGKALGRLYDNKGYIVLFTASQHAQLVMFASGLPLKDFIDVTSGSFWNTSKDMPWAYGTYLIIEKLVNVPTYEPMHDMIRHWQTKTNDLLIKWQPVGNVLTEPYHVVYENKYFSILKKGTTITPQLLFSAGPYMGVNIPGYYTTGKTISPPANYYEDSFRIISQAGMNLVRYIFYWEAYEKNPSLFMKELATVAETADRWKIKVLYDNNQYHTSSWLDPKQAYGFPLYLFEDNPKYIRGGGGNSTDPAAKVWWTDWWNRSVRSVNGTDGWTLQGKFLKNIVHALDKHSSTLGYEILNEPQVYSKDQWSKIGGYNTFMTNGLRTVTQKTIVFDRQIFAYLYGPTDATPENLAKMAPYNKTNVVFKATLYGVPIQNTTYEDTLTTYAKVAQLARVPLYMGEFGVATNNPNPIPQLNQTLTNIFIQKFKEVKVWGWDSWIWDFQHQSNPTMNLVNFTSNGTQTTKYFSYLKNAIPNFRHQTLFVATRNGDTIWPTVHLTNVSIIKPNNNGRYVCDPATLRCIPEIKIFVEGKAIDVESGIKMVDISLDGRHYVSGTPASNGDWLNWTASMPVPTLGVYHLTARVIDNAGHHKLDTITFNIAK